MPEYLMRCENGHKKVMVDSMISTVILRCPVCGTVMRRVPQVVSVNWNGLRPSQGEISGEIKDAVENADRNRAEYERMKHGD